MKSCPTCNRTYPDDTLAFCLMDGSVLSAPYDPTAKPTREVNPPATEVMSEAPGMADTGQHQLRPTAPSTPLTTIQAPPPALPARETRETPHATKSNSRAFVILGVVAVLVVAAVVVISIETSQRARSGDRVNLNVGAPNNVGASNTAATNTTTKGGSTLAEAVENKKASLREQIRSDPDNPEPHASLAQLLFIQGQYSESEKEAREAIRLDPNLSQPHYTLAFLLEKQNKTAESKAERQRADELAAKGQ
jgi:hypothetical protein